MLASALLLGGCVLPRATAQGPVPIAPRKGAAYVLPDGEVQIVTCASMANVVRALNAVFAQTHPGVKFSVLIGDNYSAMAALTFDRSAVAPLGTEYTRIGLGDNLKIAAPPVGFRVAHATLTVGDGVPQLGVIVNENNPLTSLSLSQLTRIFAVGEPGGDIAVWSQAGVIGSLASRPITPFGPLRSDYMDSDDPQAGEFISTDILSGLNMNHAYQGLPHYADVVQRVADDPGAIGITALNVPLAHVKVIALSGTDSGAPVSPTAAQIDAGRYPLDRFVYLYLRVGKGMPLDEFGKEYVRMTLSAAGQHAIAALSEGYIPLNAGELAEERAKLDLQ